MNQLQSYQELRLAPGATEREIKAAFRQLAKESHPDSGQDGGDALKFRKAYEAYRNLLAKARAHQKKERLLSGVQYQFVSRTQEDLDVHYYLDLVKSGDSFDLTLPWTAHEVCPRCFGEGRTLVQLKSGSVYRPTVCPRCGGAGHTERFSHIAVHVTKEMADSGKIRLKGAGELDHQEGRRGDLYVHLAFVDRLSETH
ncbi:MAG: DnaJ domain-containing protein [Deltaproteobacteria bacterium]|nr:DnaJ domain-containing protein [Deltaproteobacteria bacterium]